MAKTLTIVGGQWGDEGKGKIVDYFARKAQAVVRWTGGDNAGHTIYNNKKALALTILPSGILNQNCTNIVGAGCLINFEAMLNNLALLKKHRLKAYNLKIDARAQVIMPYHLQWDACQEQERQKNSKKIGTTKKGIGPAWGDLIDRQGLRVADFEDSELVLAKIKQNLKIKNFCFKNYFKTETFSPETIAKQALDNYKLLAPYVCDTNLLLEELLARPGLIIFESAQGTMLDPFFGTYPFVTSSRTIASAIACHLGLKDQALALHLGIFKAYNTRVGEGPLMGEMLEPQASLVRNKAHEFGSVTGRPRRVAWFDAVVASYSVRINGFNFIAITLLDILNCLETIKIITAYKYNNQTINTPLINALEWNKIEPVYTEMSSWTKDISNIKSYENLPKEAQAYVQKLCALMQVKWGIISVGPHHDQIIINSEFEKKLYD